MNEDLDQMKRDVDEVRDKLAEAVNTLTECTKAIGKQCILYTDAAFNKAADARKDLRRQIAARLDKHVRDTACYVETVTTGIKHTVEDLDERLTADIVALAARVDELDQAG